MNGRQLSFVCLLMIGNTACSPVANTMVEDKASLASALFDCSSTPFAHAYFQYRQHPSNTDLWPAVDCALGQPATLPAAYELQQSYRRYAADQSRHVGYKVALGSKGAQALLGTPGPVIGDLFDTAIRHSGDVISIHAGKTLAVEADLLVTVGSSEINQARSIEDVVRHLDSVTSLLEVPDLMFPLVPASAAKFIATNAGANLLVLGDTINLPPAAGLKGPSMDPERRELLSALATMEVRLMAGSTELSRATGKALMGHPLNALLYLLDELRAEDKQLKRGDVVSLGAFGSPIPVRSLVKKGEELSISVRYDGFIDHKTGRSMTVSAKFQ